MFFAGLIKAVRIQTTFLRQADRPEVTEESRARLFWLRAGAMAYVSANHPLSEIVDGMVRKCVASACFEQDKE